MCHPLIFIGSYVRSLHFPQHPERLQLYSLPTPNGVKVSIALFQSGAILIYLAQKTGQLMPTDVAQHYPTIQRVMGLAIPA